jgi:hypothetical protein
MNDSTRSSRGNANHSKDEIELAKLQLARDQFEYEKIETGRLTTSQVISFYCLNY